MLTQPGILSKQNSRVHCRHAGCPHAHLLRAGDIAAERVVAAGALHVAADLVDLALQLVGRLLRAGQPGQVAGAVALNLQATQYASAFHPKPLLAATRVGLSDTSCDQHASITA